MKNENENKNEALAVREEPCNCIITGIDSLNHYTDQQTQRRRRSNLFIYLFFYLQTYVNLYVYDDKDYVNFDMVT